MKKNLGAIFCTALLTGCASQSIHTEFVAVEQAGFQSYYSSGWIVQGHREGSDYLVELAVRDGKQPWETVNAILYVENRSEDPVTVGINDITLHQDDRQVALKSYNELEQQYIGQAQSRRTAVALGALAQSLNASQPTTTSSYRSGTAYGPGGAVNYSGTSTTYSRDPAASAAAQAQIQSGAQSGIANIRSDLQQDLNSLEGYIQKTTVFPGQTFIGRFQSEMTVFDQRPESFYRFAVEVGEESYEFTFVEKADIENNQRKLF
ncbi:hypothetical protein [Marinobacter sp. ATCH36]|uniref:hypothetical protein n=1 Tax=Marinobacter sp. ATCH36 TaxID=2945106 RepID=UPI002021E298|nr:hypothetical protein [Marinobacter sp. ATCH36]MCL7943627.1 hypothetical protein [Marinobacter sp. ATCH36]